MTESLHSRKYLKKYRKELRNNMTFSEARLWSCLRKKQLEGRRFRRQHSIGNYIVDFFCFSEKLIVEVDGTSHDDPSSEQYDNKRDEFLDANGFKIIRIKAIDVRDNLDGVLKDITDLFKEN